MRLIKILSRLCEVLLGSLKSCVGSLKSCVGTLKRKGQLGLLICQVLDKTSLFIILGGKLLEFLLKFNELPLKLLRPLLEFILLLCHRLKLALQGDLLVTKILILHLKLT